MRIRMTLLTVLVGLAMMVSLACQKPAAGGGETKLVSVTGSVTVNGAAGKAGTVLKAGDELRVEGDGAARVQYADGSRVLVFRDDSAGKPGLLTIKGSKGEGETRTMLMKISSGVLAFLVPPKRPKPLRFEIEGSSSITAIHGTEGTVLVGSSGDTVSLKSGSVTVKGLAGGETQIAAGQKVHVAAGAQPGAAEKYNYLLPSEKRFYKGGMPDVKSF